MALTDIKAVRVAVGRAISALPPNFNPSMDEDDYVQEALLRTLEAGQDPDEVPISHICRTARWTVYEDIRRETKWSWKTRKARVATFPIRDDDKLVEFEDHVLDTLELEEVIGLCAEYACGWVLVMSALGYGRDEMNLPPNAYQKVHVTRRRVKRRVSQPD